MQTVKHIKGKLVGPKNVELDQPVLDPHADAEVEVIVRTPSVQGAAVGKLSEFLRGLPAGRRTKEEIDQQIREERESWGDRG